MMQTREHFEQFLVDLAVRRRRAEAMSRSLRELAAERAADVPADVPAAPTAAPTDTAPDERPGAGLLAEATALVEVTIAELSRAETELARQNEALFDAQLRLDERDRHFQTLFELAPAAYVVTTDGGVIHEINQTGASLLGRPRNSVVGKPLALFVVAGEERSAFRAALLRLRDSTEVEVWRMRLAPNTRPPVDVTVSVRAARDHPGAPVSLYWLLRDESGRVADDLL